MGDPEEALFRLSVNTSVIHEGGMSYSQIFAYTEVALNPSQTPARVKKLKLEGTLGCTPLPHTTAARGSSTATTAIVTTQIATHVTGNTVGTEQMTVQVITRILFLLT